jgi:hypothetical protein
MNNDILLISLFGIVTKITTSVFLYLKVTHIIDWSWLWVVSPSWLFLCGVMGYHLLALHLKEPRDNK